MWRSAQTRSSPFCSARYNIGTTTSRSWRCWEGWGRKRRGRGQGGQRSRGSRARVGRRGKQGRALARGKGVDRVWRWLRCARAFVRTGSGLKGVLEGFGCRVVVYGNGPVQREEKEVASVGRARAARTAIRRSRRPCMSCCADAGGSFMLLEAAAVGVRVG